MHVTLRAREALPSLRSARVFPVLRRSLAVAHKTAFRVVHFSVQSDHVHLLVEDDHPLALVRGLQGLAVVPPFNLRKLISRGGACRAFPRLSPAARRR